jgi:hypothetical protein
MCQRQALVLGEADMEEVMISRADVKELVGLGERFPGLEVMDQVKVPMNKSIPLPQKHSHLRLNLSCRAKIMIKT